MMDREQTEQIFVGVICFVRGEMFKTHVRYIVALEEKDALEVLYRIACCLYPNIKAGDFIGRSAAPVTSGQLRAVADRTAILYRGAQCEIDEEPVMIDEGWPELIG
jgi:hypothetical protein